MNVLTPIFLLASLSGVSASAATPADYAIVLPIKTDGSSAAWQVELTTEVYGGSQDADLRDVAIFNAAGQQVPATRWQVDPTDEINEQRVRLPLFELPTEATSNSGGDLRLVIERDQEGRLHRIEASDSAVAPSAEPTRDWLLDSSDFESGIDAINLTWSTPASGIIALFDVEASDDLQHWNRLRNDAAIVLLERDGLNVERREIKLDGGFHRYLRLHRHDNGPAFSGLQVEARKRNHRIVNNVSLVWLDADRRERIGDLQLSDTHHLYALPAAVPASLMRIELANNNALAQLDVSTPQPADSGKTRWVPRARFIAFRLNQGGSEIDSGEIAIPRGPRMRELRIDSATPLSQSPQVRVGYQPDRLVFLAEGDGPYLLAAGSRHARRPDYPVGAAIESLRAQLGRDWQPPLATLGTAQPGAGAADLLAVDEPVAWKRGLLWAVLILAAAVVGGIALSLLRSSAQGSAEERQQPPEK